jgi:hypothetical protein
MIKEEHAERESEERTKRERRTGEGRIRARREGRVNSSSIEIYFMGISICYYYCNNKILP